MMDKDCVYRIEIETRTKEECIKLGNRIGEQLRGEDYLNNNILLNFTDVDNVIRLYIFEECKEIPKLSLF